MSKKHFDTIEQEIDYKKKQRKRTKIVLNTIILIICVPILINYVVNKVKNTIKSLKSIPETGTHELLVVGGLCLATLIIAAILYIIFKNKGKKFSWKNWHFFIVAATGIILLGMFVLMVVKDLW